MYENKFSMCSSFINMCILCEVRVLKFLMVLGIVFLNSFMIIFFLGFLLILMLRYVLLVISVLEFVLICVISVLMEYIKMKRIILIRLL